MTEEPKEEPKLVILQVGQSNGEVEMPKGWKWQRQHYLSEEANTCLYRAKKEAGK